MKSVTQTLKTLTLGLTLVYSIGSVAFAAGASPAEKILDKAQLMEFLRDGGIPDGTSQGKTLEGKSCALTIITKAGEEKISLASEGEDEQRFLLNESELDASYIKFKIRETKTGVGINQDLDDSYQDMEISKVSGDEVRFTFTESAGGLRSSTCVLTN